MINHARTLLKNSKRGQVALPGEEYEPPEFQPLVLPRAAILIRQVLYGENPDGWKLNYRLQELLTLLHSTEFDEYLLALDPRITYWPFTARLFDLVTGAVARILRGTTPLTLGGGQPVEHRGALYFRWTLQAIGSDTLEVTQTYPQLRHDLLDVTFDDGLSAPVTLPGSPLTVQVPSLTPGDQWQITGLARPSQNLADLTYQLRQLPAETLAWVFGDFRDEPQRTFYNCWQQQETTYQLAGFLCAFIYRLDALRQRG